MRSGHDKAAPSEWVRRFASLVEPSGSVLDVASGSGRHTQLFLDRGNRVTAVDRDVEALRLLDSKNLRVVEADLEEREWPFRGVCFDAVVVTNYLWRDLFSSLADAIVPGGVLIYETFMRGNERLGKPRNPDFLLRPGELYDVFSTLLDVVAFEQGEVSEPRPAVVQRLVATRPSSGRLSDSPSSELPSWGSRPSSRR